MALAPEVRSIQERGNARRRASVNSSEAALPAGL